MHFYQELMVGLILLLKINQDLAENGDITPEGY